MTSALEPHVERVIQSLHEGAKRIYNSTASTSAEDIPADALKNVVSSLQQLEQSLSQFENDVQIPLDVIACLDQGLDPQQGTTAYKRAVAQNQQSHGRLLALQELRQRLSDSS